MLSIFRFFTANFILIYLGSAHLYAGESEVLLAVKGIEAISGLSADEDFTKIIPAFYALPKNPDQKSIKDLFENSRVASWSATVAEYISVAQIYFDSLPSAEQDLNRLDFDRYKLALLELQNAINHYVLGIHPGFILPGIKNLRTQFSG
ncbi:MAG: hypothetical protein NTX25_21340, partial [Proteobacteria bacterium]|nr:hypothetical protein [Pseudomonadota bacterium]